jgi:hypothetical protein
MNANARIESLGKIIKEETLQSVTFNVIQNTLVLENLEPFPGYHGENLPIESAPESVFLMTTKACLTETIFRLSRNICSYHNLSFDACPAEITLFNTPYYGIRLKGLHSYTVIADIQGCFIDQGIPFLKYKKIRSVGVMKIEKIFRLEKIDENVYKDQEDALTYYLEIPYSFNWNLFKKVTGNIKNNLENRNFDAAIGFVYMKEIVDFIRIYANTDISRLKHIREKYLEEISHIRQH